MSKLVKSFGYLHIILRASMLIDVFYRCRNSEKDIWIFFICFLLVQINDYLRICYFYKDHRIYYASLFASVILSSIVVFNLAAYSDVYMFLILYEIIFYSSGKIFRLLMVLEISLYIGLMIFRTAAIGDITSFEFWKNNILDLIMSTLLLLSYSFACLSYRALLREKRRVDTLNEELEQSYNKLEDQSKKIEELVITEERNRIAGEIHDNLGHTLVALNMNLDVAQNLIDRDIEKSKGLISKSRVLTKDSLNDLRKAVYALKEENPGSLTDSIKRIIENVESVGKVKVNLNIDENSDDLLLSFKDTICNSIKEALTNSIKHGKANQVNIDIKIVNDNAHITINDNGLGCDTLTKGNGLVGIENRILSMGGKVTYNSEKGKGFEIGIELSL
ncbi:MAG: sensor histidine kinase [Tissierellales bacterium]